MDREQVRRLIDEAIRDLAGKGETNVTMAAKISELETSVKYAAGAYMDFRKDMAEGFKGIYHRLDKMNGTMVHHEERLEKQGNRITSIETSYGTLKTVFLPVLIAVATALIIAQITGSP